MRNWLVILFISFILTCCQEKISKSDLAKLNGYWEIEKAVLPDGTQKQYTFNESYDYFEITHNKGFRKKVMPQLDGTFLSNEIVEEVFVVFENDKTYLKYMTPYSKWREELKYLSDGKMVVLNAEQKEYHYKKATAVNVTHGKTAQ